MTRDRASGGGFTTGNRNQNNQQQIIIKQPDTAKVHESKKQNDQIKESIITKWLPLPLLPSKSSRQMRVFGEGLDWLQCKPNE